MLFYYEYKVRCTAIIAKGGKVIEPESGGWEYIPGNTVIDGMRRYAYKVAKANDLTDESFVDIEVDLDGGGGKWRFCVGQLVDEVFIVS